MSLPRLSVTSARAALARPAVLASVTALALAGLLGGGLLVASATDSSPVPEADASASPTASPTASATATATVGQASPGQASPSSRQVGGGEGGTGTTSGGDDNVAVAVNTRDGSTVYAIRLKVVLTGADTVDSGNAAVAVASCSDCQTVAIALEGVIVTGDAEVIAPENLALAINSGCSNCQTLAYAYQNLQTVDGKVRLTGAGRAGIGSLRQQLQALRTSGLDLPAVRAEVDRIAGEFAAILKSEVVPLGRPAGTPIPGATPGVAGDAGATSSPPAGMGATPADGKATQPPVGSDGASSTAPASTPPRTGSDEAGSAEPAATATPSAAG